MELSFFLIISMVSMLGILLCGLMMMMGNSEWYEKIYFAILAAFSVVFIFFLYKTGLYKMLWPAFVKGLVSSITLLVFCIPLILADLIDG